MRVDTTDLDVSVVEDGEAPIILKSDSQILTTKNRELSGKSPTLKDSCLSNGVEMTKKASKTEDGGDAVRNRQREPVEDSEDVEEPKDSSEDNVDQLTNSLKGISIQETPSLDIEKKLAQLAVNDEEDEDTRCSSVQSSQSIITVDPPSLPHEQEEEKAELADDLAPRGPTAGKPANFRPNNEAYNHISNKSYSSHNLNRFQPFPLYQYPPAVNGYPQNGYGPGEFSHSAYNNSVPVAGSGKRGMDDEEETPFKYTRPVEEMGYSPSQSNDLNNLNGCLRKQPTFSQTSTALGCGGQVVDNSPSPAEELSGTPFKFMPQISMTDVENMLEVLSAQGQQQPQQQQQQPQQQQQLSQQIPNPLEQMTHQYTTDVGVEQMGKMMGGRSVRDFDPGYSSENSPHSDIAGSPGSSPKSTFSPMTPHSNMSQDSGIASPLSDDNMSTVVNSPPGDFSHTQSWVPEDIVNPQYTVPDTTQSGMHRNPPSVTSVMSPLSDDSSMVSAPSPMSDSDSRIDYMFSQRRDELKDALDVIYNDMKSSKKKAVSQTATQPAASVPPMTTSTAATPYVGSNIPTPVAQQKSMRPGKLPIAPLQKQARPGGAGSQQQQQSAMLQGALPVMVVPATVGVQPVTTAAPVSSSQPVLVMNPGQSSSVILLFNGNQQNTTPAKKKPVPIKPRPCPAIVDSAPKPMDNKAGVRTDLPVTKQESNGSGVSMNDSGPAGARVHNGGRPASCSQPSAAQSAPGRKPAQGRNPPQSKMLNTARRLVAGMTTTDLQFQDGEGDTYLHVSVCQTDSNMVQALLERLTREQLQSMVNTQNLMRQTPLYLAVSSNAPEMVELLIQYGGDVNVLAEHVHADGRSTERKAALHCTASNGHQYLRTLQALLSAKDLIIDQFNSDGHTALHCAILEHNKTDGEGGLINNLPIIQALIRHGADINAQGKTNGKTALMYALETRDIDLIEHIVALVDPASLRIYLRTQAYDGTTCQRILENLQRSLDNSNRQRLLTCIKINSRRDNSTS